MNLPPRARRIVLWGLLALGLLVIMAVVYFLVINRVPAGEVAEIAAKRGDYRLRDPMRPPGKGMRVLVIALDGVGYDELAGALATGKLPHLSTILGTQQGDAFEHGILVRSMSTLPSTTMAAWASIYTGKPPAESGIPGNEWFDRRTMHFYAPAPVTIEEYGHTLLMLSDGLVGKQVRVPTLFEIVDRRSFVSLAPIYRGADFFTTPAPEVVGGLFLGVTKGVVGVQNIDRQIYEEVDEEAAENLVEAIEEYGIPDLTVSYFPGVDLYTHVAGRPLNEEINYLREVIDPEVGNLIDAYRKAGVLDSTYVMVIADHGHTPVLEDDLHALGNEGDDEPTSLLEKLGFRMRPAMLDAPDSSFQAVVAYQGAMAYIYLADRSTCPANEDPCDWNRPPRYQEDLLPVARAFYEASRNGTRIPALKGTLDLVFARKATGPGQDAPPFQVYDGTRFLSINEYLKSHPRPDLLDLERRMNGLASGPHGHLSGDILLLSHSGMERPIEDRFYFSHEYRSWHGSPTAQDSYVPILVACSGQSSAQIRARIGKVLGPNPTHERIVPTIVALTGR